MASAVRLRSRSMDRIFRALYPTGPTGTALDAARGTFRNASPWPVAGASTTMRSYFGRRGQPVRSSSRTMILPITISSGRPGAAAKNRR